jgi:hypothetical protein
MKDEKETMSRKDKLEEVAEEMMKKKKDKKASMDKLDAIKMKYMAGKKC